MGSYDPYTFTRRQDLEQVDWQHIDGAHVDPELLKFDGFDVPVYRYVEGAPEATALLDDRRLRFDHPTTWLDKYEHYVAQQLFDPDAPFGNMAVYAKCFTYHYASEAFWRINAGRVRLKFRSLRALVQRLVNAKRIGGGALPKLFVGRVRYMEQADLRRVIEATRKAPIKPVSRFAAEAVLMKRIGFCHENEVRIFYVGDGSVSDSKALDIELKDPAPIEKLLVGPYLPPSQNGALSQHSLFGEIIGCANRHKLVLTSSQFDLEVKPIAIGDKGDS